MKNLIYDFLQYSRDIDFRTDQVILHYKYDLLNFRKYLLYRYHKQEINVEEVTMQDCILFIEHYKKVRNASKNTLSWLATSNRKFFKYLASLWYKIQFNVEQLPIIKKERKPFDMMQRNEYDTFIQAPLIYEEKPILAERNQLLIEIPYKTWLRRAEILRCRFSHFHNENRQFQILWKGWYYDRVFFTEELRSKVLQYEEHLNKFTRKRPLNNDFLFIGLDNKNRWKPLACKYVNYIFNKYSDSLIEEWKIQRRLHPHMERHSFATNCVYAWLSQQATTRLMRHRDPKTTENYYHLNDTRLKSQFDMIR